MPRDTLAPYPWPCSVSWCLAEGYRNGDQRHSNGPMWLVMATLLFTFFCYTGKLQIILYCIIKNMAYSFCNKLLFKLIRKSTFQILSFSRSQDSAKNMNNFHSVLVLNSLN